MPQTHGVRNFYWHPIRIRKGTRLHHRCETREYEEPFRVGHSHILRVPWTTLGVAFGRWASSVADVDSAILEAVQGRVEAADVTGEHGTSVQQHVKQVYERRMQTMPDDMNGWVVR